MNRIVLALLTMMTFFGANLNGQENENKLKTEVSGIIWFQYYHDTWQNVETRDGALLLYPKPKDAAGINEAGKMGSSAFFTRPRIKFSGAEAFGAKASGVLEGDFFATSQDMVGHLRLRHAFLKLDWDRTSLLFGQFWHTIVDTDVIPSSDLIANVPFFPLNRSPQISINYKLTDELSINAAALVHSYHRSSGFPDFQRNAGIPEFAGKIKYKSGNFVIGVNGGIKTLKPRIKTDLGVKTTKNISTPYLGAFTKIKTDPVTVKGQIVYGQNLTHFVMIGGMGAVDTAGVDDYDYSALKTVSTWADIHTNGKKVQFGLFFGFSQMLGATDNYLALAGEDKYGLPVKYHRSDNLHSTMRISPRIDFFSGKMKLGFEYSYTNAIYGTAWDSKRVATAKADPVANNRFLLNVMYRF